MNVRRATLCLVTLCHGLSAQSVPIVNHDFEDVLGMTVTAPGSVYTGTPAGWTFRGTGEVQILAYGYCGALVGGRNRYFLEAHTEAEPGTLWQTVSGLTLGASYRFSFLWGNRGDSCHPGLDGFDFAVSIGGQVFARSGSGRVDMTFQSLVFVASSSSETIEITFHHPGSATHTNGAFDAFELTRVTSGTPGVATPYGTGCGSPPLSLHPTLARPIIGATTDVLLTNVPAGIAVLALGLSRSSFAGLPLPLPLGELGMPGCFLWQSVDLPAWIATATSGSTALFGLPVPNETALIGQHVFLQAWAPAPGANPADLVLSQGLDVRFGDS